jgi:hypothetical protein
MKNYFSIAYGGAGRFLRRLIGQPTFDAVIKDDFPTITKHNPDIYIPNPGETHQAMPALDRAAIEELIQKEATSTTSQIADISFYEQCLERNVQEFFDSGRISLDGIFPEKAEAVEFKSISLGEFNLREEWLEQTQRLENLVTVTGIGLNTVDELYRVNLGLTGSHKHENLSHKEGRLEYAQQAFEHLVDTLDHLHNKKGLVREQISEGFPINNSHLTEFVHYVLRPFGVELWQSFSESQVYDNQQKPLERLEKINSDLKSMMNFYFTHVKFAQLWSRDKRGNYDTWGVDNAAIGAHLLHLGPQNVTDTISTYPNPQQFIYPVKDVTDSMFIPSMSLHKTLPPELPPEEVTKSRIIEQSALYTSAKPPPLPGTSYKKSEPVVLPPPEIFNPNFSDKTTTGMHAADSAIAHQYIADQSPREIVAQPYSENETPKNEPKQTSSGTLLGFFLSEKK